MRSVHAHSLHSPGPDLDQERLERRRVGIDTGYIRQEEGEKGRVGVADGAVGRGVGWLVRQKGKIQSRIRLKNPDTVLGRECV